MLAFIEPKFKPIGEKECYTAAPEDPSKLNSSPSASPPSGDVSPSSRALEILKSLPKDFFSPVKAEDKMKEEKELEREGRKGDKDIFKSAVDQESFREAFLKALNESGTSAIKNVKGGHGDPLPPVLKHPLNAESLAKPFQEKLYGFDQGHGPNPASNLWTPSLDRSKLPQNMSAMGQSISNWEIDTPYVGRNNRELPPPRPLASGSKMMPPPPAVAPAPAAEESKKKKKRRRHRSSSSSSSSSEEDAEEKKKSENDEIALERKKKILSKVWTLMEQKKKLEAQRDEVVLSHKGDGKSLATLLKENSILSSEIDRQIFVMNQMVQGINDKLGMSKLEAQQQEFFFQPNMYKDNKSYQTTKKNMLTEKTLEKSISKFLKPPEDSGKKSPPSPPPKRTKKVPKSRSRSKSRDRKRSASPPEKKPSSKRHSYEKRVKKEKSPPPPDDVKMKKKKEVKKSSVSASAKTKSHPKPVGEVEYSPSPAMKPHVKYIDQGMHWCKVCNDFLDTVQDFVDHLETGIHMENLKSDAKAWLPKPVKIEKDPVDPNAPVLTIPLQGMEFINSITAFYCALCDAFLKTKEEAQMHSETKLHVSKYKEHLSKNPMYETMYVREKMAAFAKYSVDKERRKEKNPSLDNLKSQVFFSEVKNKTDENIPRVQQSKSPPPSVAPPPPPPLLPPPPVPPKMCEPVVTAKENVNARELPPPAEISSIPHSNDASVAGSIRVASRCSVSSFSDEKGAPVNSSSYNPLGQIESESGVVAKRETSPVRESKVPSESEGNNRHSHKEDKKLHSLKRRVSDVKERSTSSPSSERDRDVARAESAKPMTEEDSSEKTAKSSHGQSEHQSQNVSKLNIKKYSNVIIGKMPFLKKSSKGGPSVPKTPTEETKSLPEASPISEAEKRIRQMVSQGLPTVTPKEEETTLSLPPSVPRNLEYITEIESSGSGTTFTKMFGPTLERKDDLSEEDSQEAPMDISHDDDSSSEEEIPRKEEPSQYLKDIPVPVDPTQKAKSVDPPLESKLKVDMSNPHLSQLSAAAAMYKDAVAFQPLPMPPSPFLQLPPVPPMLNPMFPPFNPVPPPAETEPYIEGLNPPPPGTEEGSSNPSSGNAPSDGGDSPDSFLCQKTPPPPGTEDDGIKPVPRPLPSAAAERTTPKREGTEHFKDMLADVPVLAFGASAAPQGVTKDDDGSQESLVQEGLELLEFADEDDDKEREKDVQEEEEEEKEEEESDSDIENETSLRNKSPPATRSKRKAAVLAQAAMKAMGKD